MGFISAPSPLEIMVILALALIVLGPARLPDAARSVGRGVREFRDSLSRLEDEPEDERYRGADDDAEPDEDEDEDEPDERGDEADELGGDDDSPQADDGSKPTGTSA